MSNLTKDKPEQPTGPKMARYVALEQLERHGKVYPPGQWVQLEVETGELLGSKGFVFPAEDLDTDAPDVGMLHKLVNSKAVFSEGALRSAFLQLGLKPAAARRLAMQHLPEEIKRRGSAAGVVGSVTVEDLKRWAQ